VRKLREGERLLGEGKELAEVAKVLDLGCGPTGNGSCSRERVGAASNSCRALCRTRSIGTTPLG
jgi:hypothetical protein